MTKQKLVELTDWALKAIIVGLCTVIMTMRADITTLMIRTEGVDKMVMQHEKRLDVNEQSDRELSTRVYNIKLCCE